MRIAATVTQLLLIVMLTRVSGLAVGDDPSPPVNVGTAKRLTWDDSLLDKAEGIRAIVDGMKQSGRSREIGRFDKTGRADMNGPDETKTGRITTSHKREK